MTLHVHIQYINKFFLSATMTCGLTAILLHLIKVEGEKQISSIIIPTSSGLGWRFCCHGYYTHQESKFKL